MPTGWRHPRTVASPRRGSIGGCACRPGAGERQKRRPRRRVGRRSAERRGARVPRSVRVMVVSLVPEGFLRVIRRKAVRRWACAASLLRNLRRCTRVLQAHRRRLPVLGWRSRRPLLPRRCASASSRVFSLLQTVVDSAASLICSSFCFCPAAERLRRRQRAARSASTASRRGPSRTRQIKGSAQRGMRCETGSGEFVTQPTARRS